MVILENDILSQTLVNLAYKYINNEWCKISTFIQEMASLKLEKPVGSQSGAAPKKAPANAKAPATKPGSAKGELKPREPKKKAKFYLFVSFFPSLLFLK